MCVFARSSCWTHGIYAHGKVHTSKVKRMSMYFYLRTFLKEVHTQALTRAQSIMLAQQDVQFAMRKIIKIHRKFSSSHSCRYRFTNHFISAGHSVEFMRWQKSNCILKLGANRMSHCDRIFVVGKLENCHQTQWWRFENIPSSVWIMLFRLLLPF